MWLFFSSFCVGLFPLWQGRKTAAHTIKSMIRDLAGHGGGGNAKAGQSRNTTLLQGQQPQSPPQEREQEKGSDSGESGGVKHEVAEVKEKQ